MAAERGAAVTIPRAEMHDIVSDASGENYRIFIWRPRTPPPPEGYPVVTVLDGNAVFGLVSDIVGFAELRPRPDGIAPAVVVAIGYPVDTPLDFVRRSFDLTPPADTMTLPERPNGKPWPKVGGADAFLAFLETQVKPLVAARVPVDPRREVLMGHSFGGLFALHVLFTRPDAFDAYLAGSPSIWFNDGALAGEADALVASGRTVAARLYVAVGGDEQRMTPPPDDTVDPAARKRWRRANRMVDNAREMAARLDGAVPGLDVAFQVFDGEDHGSVVPAFVSRALRYALSPATAAPADE
ncbi:alpha/beta hydrolase [Acuticoccus sp. I52.16.1]|uniref:alpha/beta hydrolase n=1 Tax=Acuticoccus sp. I52.16.1 TaxID=2928472 RepID=UPI001FD0FD21|nr:alpha/beta hydrolase-fold protein [Acuticoccus sp. I52.16.1]UOM35633.1 alpha/beta hydrolase-fold protein [Acuticoccus sp. I52.16.1]